MVDFETLGTSKDAVVLSVGLVVFNRETCHAYDKVYEEFDVPLQIYRERTVDPSTVSWWLKKDPMELKRLLVHGFEDPYEMLPEALASLDFKYVWSRHPMDFDILSTFVPLDYWRFRDVSTLDYLKKMDTKNTHNALEDCLNQLEHLRGVRKGWDARNVEATLMNSMEHAQDVDGISSHTS